MCVKAGLSAGSARGVTHRRLLCEIVVVACCGGMVEVSAAEWSATPQFWIGAESNDNFTLVSDQDKKWLIQNGSVDTRVALQAADATTQYRLTPRIKAVDYFGSADSLWDYTGAFLDGDVSKEASNGRWDLSAGYSRDTRLTTQLEQTGFITARKPQDEYQASLNRTFVFSPRDSFRLGGQYTEITYPDKVLTPLYGYQVEGANLSLIREFGEVSQASLQVSGSRVEASQVGNTTDTYQAQMQWVSQWSEDLGYILSLGKRQSEYRTEFRDQTFESTNGGTVFQLKAHGDVKYGLWSIGVNRSVTPTTNGLVSEQDQLIFSLSRDLTESLTTRIEGTASRYQAGQQETEQFVAQNREYQQIYAELGWRIGRNWRLVTGYTFKRQQFDAQPEDARSNAITAGFSYQGDPYTLSR